VPILPAERAQKNEQNDIKKVFGTLAVVPLQF